jgi:hypothetical protein
VSRPTIAQPSCGECETFRLAIHIAKPPRIEERSGTASGREII